MVARWQTESESSSAILHTLKWAEMLRAFIASSWISKQPDPRNKWFVMKKFSPFHRTFELMSAITSSERTPNPAKGVYRPCAWCFWQCWRPAPSDERWDHVTSDVDKASRCYTGNDRCHQVASDHLTTASHSWHTDARPRWTDIRSHSAPVHTMSQYCRLPRQHMQINAKLQGGPISVAGKY